MQLQFPAMPAELTNAEQRILEYIATHTDTFLFMTIGQLADCLGLSDATLSRFARHVGCKDFRELKHVVMQQSAENGPAWKMAATLVQETAFSPQSWLTRQQLCLQKTMEQMDTAEFDCAVQALLQAGHIFIHAKSASSALGQLLLFRLRRLGLRVVLLPSGGSEVLEGLVQAGPGDLVVMFCFSKISHEGRMLLDYRQQAGYRTLAFTSRLYIPETDRADMNLYICRGEEKEYHSMAAPAAVVDALVVALSEQMGSASASRLGLLHRLKTRYAGMK